MISKELLSEVLHGGRITIKDLGNMENCLEYVSYCSINEMNGTKHNENLPDNYYVVKADRGQEINIYELAHKCKEWAFKKGYFVQSDFMEVNIYPIEYDGCKMKLLQCFDIVPIDCDSYTEEEIDSFPHNEIEAIFEACEWILKEKK